MVVQQVLQISSWNLILVQQVLQSGASSFTNGATSYTMNTQGSGVEHNIFFSELVNAPP